ncbi:NAD(P)/FAD-dependent oxidoreductase [Cellulomonas fimi]|uniref:dihydrolipoyl dehydrogenase family protein n=1 Tax=Cellulomonas fimi TaxID=1708 RepID=UPI00234DDAA4|nr:NAD(P)/FAD-dependent oxidoreductase [Cellulomonas fimi]MDC7122143.1 NAD(P)/FAD-dependent oxidoreductase [Cellulomonas fimi]
MPSQQEFDVVVVGGGAVGENVADRASRTGLSVALVEHALVGGECSYWACMPSKVLLRAGAVLAAARGVPGAKAAVADSTVDAAAVLARRDEIVHHWDDASQVSWVESAGLTLLRGHARLTGPRTLLVSGETETEVRARHAVVLATGSEPVVPDVPGLAEAGFWTSREATAVREVPARLAVLGGGVVGVEMARAYADLGSEVTIVVRGGRLLGNAEPFAGEAVADDLRAAGVRVLLHAETTAVRRDDGGVHLEIGATSGGPHPDASVVHASEVLVATGRRPRTGQLGLETVGLTPGEPLRVDDALQVVGVDEGWLFAAGDVTGRTATTHQGKYDARVVGDVVAARFHPDGADADGGPGAERDAAPWSRYRATADVAAVPQVVFSRPEVAWVGRTEAQARRDGIDVRVLRYDLADVAGASVASEDYPGVAQLVVDQGRNVVVGATFVGPDAAEMLHAATIAVVGEVPLDRLWHAVPSYPTVSEVWLRLLEAAGL